MRKNIPSSRRALTLAVISGLSIHALPAVAQDTPVEEVVVTGSYFRGSPLDAPSPVQVVDRSSIEAQGAAVIWDVIKNLEVNSGSISNPGSGDNTQVSGSANVNLRNLGENSTLTLINGKRRKLCAIALPEPSITDSMKLPSSTHSSSILNQRFTGVMTATTKRADLRFSCPHQARTAVTLSVLRSS